MQGTSKSQSLVSAQSIRNQIRSRTPQWAWLQALITFVMGVPYEGQTPLYRHTPLTVYFLCYLQLMLSVVAGTLAVMAFTGATPVFKIFLLVAIVVIFMTTTGLIRLAHHTLLHHAAHDSLGKYSVWLGEVASLTALSLPLPAFRERHAQHHGHPAEVEDPDVKTIMDFGFKPGQSVPWYWRHLWRLLLSPRALLDLQVMRFKFNFAPGVPLWRKLALVLVQGIPLTFAAAMSLSMTSLTPLTAYIVVWLLPLTVGFFWSMVLYMLGLHLWLIQDQPGQTRRAALMQRTGARFFGSPAPETGSAAWKNIGAWSAWTARFLVRDLLLSRIFTVLGDNSQHDVHHVNPRRFDWANAAYARPEAIENSKGEFWETIGLFQAIEKTFEVLSALPPDYVPPEGDGAHLWPELEGATPQQVAMAGAQIM